METYKVGIIGDFYSGKTSIIKNITENNSSTTTTLALDFQTVVLDNIKVTIWDTAGQERFGALTTNYLRDVDGIILVHDLTRNKEDSEMKDIDKWIDTIRNATGHNETPIVIAMNKVDEYGSMERLILHKGCECFYTSAKYDKKKVKDMFRNLIIQMRLKKFRKKEKENSIKISSNDSKKRKSKCKCG